MSSTFTENITLTTINCGCCGATYAINERYRAQKEEQGGTWHCPYCQTGWGYVESENTKLQKRLAEKERLLTAAKCAEVQAITARESAERKLKRTCTRVKAGVCPCCNRTVKQLAAHMATKHPGFKP